MRHKMLSEALKERFGTKVYKLSMTSGCTCPNRDGKIGYGGCTFCSEGGSGDFAAPFLSPEEQEVLDRTLINPCPEAVFDLAREYNCETTRIYRIRARALYKLARLRYGAGL